MLEFDGFLGGDAILRSLVVLHPPSFVVLLHLLLHHFVLFLRLEPAHLHSVAHGVVVLHGLELRQNARRSHGSLDLLGRRLQHSHGLDLRLRLLQGVGRRRRKLCFACPYKTLLVIH